LIVKKLFELLEIMKMHIVLFTQNHSLEEKMTWIDRQEELPISREKVRVRYIPQGYRDPDAIVYQIVDGKEVMEIPAVHLEWKELVS
jgi:hypothetical protein